MICFYTWGDHWISRAIRLWYNDIDIPFDILRVFCENAWITFQYAIEKIKSFLKHLLNWKSIKWQHFQLFCRIQFGATCKLLKKMQQQYRLSLYYCIVFSGAISQEKKANNYFQQQRRLLTSSCNVDWHYFCFNCIFARNDKAARRKENQLWCP